MPANLDATKLRRAIFIAAASAWYLANRTDGRDTLALIREGALRRAADTLRRAQTLSDSVEVGVLWHHYHDHEIRVALSGQRYSNLPVFERPVLERIYPNPPARPSGAVYRRVLREGPMNGFGYSWFDDRLARAGLTRPRLLARQPVWEGPSYGYEALNLVDNERSVREIRDELSATLGPVPEEEVAEYLEVLARLGVIERRPY